MAQNFVYTEAGAGPAQNRESPDIRPASKTITERTGPE